MPVYFVLMHHVHDREKFNQYIEEAGPLLPPEMEILALDESPELVEGSDPAPRTMVGVLPTREAFWTFYNSPEYQKAFQNRKESTTGTLVLAEGFVPPSE